MKFIIMTTAIVFVNTLFLAWFIKQYFQYRLDSKFMEQEFYFRLYFPINEAMICVECDCVFSKEDFQSCPSCGNEQNIQLSCALDPLMQYQHKLKLHKIISQEAYV